MHFLEQSVFIYIDILYKNSKNYFRSSSGKIEHKIRKIDISIYAKRRAPSIRNDALPN